MITCIKQGHFTFCVVVIHLHGWYVYTYFKYENILTENSYLSTLMFISTPFYIEECDKISKRRILTSRVRSSSDLPEDYEFERIKVVAR